MLCSFPQRARVGPWSRLTPGVDRASLVSPILRTPRMSRGRPQSQHKDPSISIRSDSGRGYPCTATCGLASQVLGERKRPFEALVKAARLELPSSFFATHASRQPIRSRPKGHEAARGGGKLPRPEAGGDFCCSLQAARIRRAAGDMLNTASRSSIGKFSSWLRQQRPRGLHQGAETEQDESRQADSDQRQDENPGHVRSFRWPIGTAFSPNPPRQAGT